uniref:EF-hand domain-containing protein n=1 Tax=Alexandrium monilatum TaxID=311494 RepID=A0A7S4W3B1_9DINO
MEEEGEQHRYVISTVEVDPDTLQRLDTKNSCLEKDGSTVRLPSQANACQLQLWEVYVAVAILIVQPHSSVLSAHVKALCEHSERTHLCESVLKEHTAMGIATDTKQDTTLYSFLEEYFQRKFQILFARNSLHGYLMHALDDPHCGRNGIPRVYLLGPHVQAFLLNAPYWDGQYDELIDAMRSVNLPVNDILQDGENEIGEAVDIAWDHAALYDDPHMILKRYGGWAVTKAGHMYTPKDQLVMRLTGCTLEEILRGEDIPDSPRVEGDPEDDLERQQQQAEKAKQAFQQTAAKASRRGPADKSGRPLGGTRRAKTFGGTKGAWTGLEDLDSDSDGSHASDYDIDPEHPKVVPFGLTLCEAYLLLRGLLVGMGSRRAWRGSIVAEQVAHGRKDGHILAAAVLVDLYMREQIDIHHWTLTEGSIAVAFRAEPRANSGRMDHFLDEYAPHVDAMFRDMRLPRGVSEGPIWASLEERGVIDNHRPSRGRAFARVDVWDFVRPDVLLDLKDGYLTSARVLYDREFEDPLNEESNDALMFCHLLQLLFDDSLEAIDGMARVLSGMCPPFQKGELFPPVAMVHSSSVCLGIIDRAFRFANNQEVQLAMEAAEFNEVVMQRLEETFFISPSIWEVMDTDMSGELSIEEFVEGMRKADVYKDFRKERVPEDVLRTIVGDLAERLFQEVDINMDGTLTHAELQLVYKRRREEALRNRKQRTWTYRLRRALSVQTGFATNEKKGPRDPERAAALAVQTEERRKFRTQERERMNEWNSEVDRIELLDEDVDVDTSVPVFR